MKQKTKSARGFSLLETLIAMGLGLAVVGAGVAMFRSATNAAQLAFSRSDMQQNARGALAIITRDLSQAAIGIPQAGISLPSGGGVTALAACSPTSCYLQNGAYPGNLLAPVVPFDAQGAGNTDALTVVYTDNTWPVTNKTVSAVAQNGGTITVDTATYDLSGKPAAPPVGHAYNDAVYGTKVGDVLMVFNINGYAVATVTAVGANGVLSLSGGDPLRLNQAGATSGNIPSLRNAPNGQGVQSYPTTTAARLNVVTYFIQTNPGPDGILGTADDYPVLMRQVNAQNAIPLTDYVSAMAISYDAYDSVNSTYLTALDGVAVPNSSEIRKINITVTLQSSGTGTARNEQYKISTSISPRDLSFKDRYR